MNGKLIIIEAGDGSGKATQTQKLYERLLRENYKVKKVEFPNYESPSSALVKMYLNGEFGQDAHTVSPYVASTFFVVDRYASFKKDWEGFYREGGIILADRYTTSNMVHQAAKIQDEKEWEKFLSWLMDFEYNIFALPSPDAVIFLDVPPEFSLSLISARVGKSAERTNDIHEANAQYLVHSYQNAKKVAAKFNWHRIECVSANRLKSIEEIHEEIYAYVVGKIFDNLDNANKI